MSDRPPPPDPGAVTRSGSYLVAFGFVLIGAALVALVLVEAYR